jgi:hypothetical protein
MTQLLPWIVILHILGAFTFVLAHGVSAFVAFRIRSERDPARIASLLEFSSSSLGVMYSGFMVLLIAGIVAGLVEGWRLWMWAAIVVLFAVAVAMYVLATQYYANVRRAVGLSASNDPKDAPPPVPANPEALAALLDTRRPEVIAAVGGAGLAVLVWLMVAKPF